MLFNFAIIFSSIKIIFSKRKMKHFLLFGIIIILGEYLRSIRYHKESFCTQNRNKKISAHCVLS